MATIQEAQIQVSETQKQVVQQRQQIQQTRPPQLTQQQLRRQTPASALQLKEQQREFEKSKQEALRSLEQYEKETIDPYQEQIQKAQTEQQVYEKALKEYQDLQYDVALAKEYGFSPEKARDLDLTPRQQELYEQFKEYYLSRKAMTEQRYRVKELGLDMYVTSKGGVEFRDPSGAIVKIEELPAQSLKELQKLQLVELKEVPIEEIPMATKMPEIFLPKLTEPQKEFYKAVGVSTTAVTTLPPSLPITGFEKLIGVTYEDIGRGAEKVTKGIGKVGELPFPTMWGKMKLGEAAGLVTEIIPSTAEMSKKGWEDILFKQIGFKKTKEEPSKVIQFIPQQATYIEPGFEPIGAYGKVYIPKRKEVTILGTVPSTIGKAFEWAPYLIPIVGETYLGLQALSGAEKYKQLDKSTQKEINKQYKLHNEQELQEGYRYLTKDEFVLQYGEEIKQTLKRGAVLETIAPLAFLGGLGAFRGYREFTKPIVTKVPVRKPMEPLFVEKGVTIVKEGKPIRMAEYVILGETKPPILVEATTPWRKTLKMKPKISYVEPAKRFRIETLKPAIGETPFEVGLRVTGRRYVEVSEILGRARPTSLEAFEKLPMGEQKLWQRLVEDVTGRPVAMKNVPKMLRKESTKVTGYIETQRIMRIKKIGERKLRITTPWKPGKTIERAETVSELIRIAETPETKLYGAKVYFRPTTYPFQRVPKEVPKMKGLIFEVKEPIYLDVERAVQVMRPAKVPKTPWTIQVPELLVPKVVGVKLPKVTMPKPELIKLEIKPGVGLPRMVGGLGLEEVPYAGVGVYETYPTEAGVKTKVISGIKVEEISAITPISKQLSVLEQPSLLKQPQKERIIQKEFQVLEPKQELKTILKLKQKLKQKQLLEQEQVLLQKISMRQAQISRPKPKPKPKPRIIVPPIIPESSLLQRLAKKIEIEPDLFTVFAKRAGKEFEVGKVKTKEEAKGLMLKTLKGTLRASAFVKKAGKIVPLKEFGGFGAEFRRGKKAKEVLVQLKETRLGTRAETKEIQFFRKKVGKKKRKSSMLGL